MGVCFLKRLPLFLPFPWPLFHRPAPSVAQLQQKILQTLDAQGRSVVLVLYFGRERYMRILLPYLLRNLRQHGGIVDRIVMCMTTMVPQDRKYAATLTGLPNVTLHEPPKDMLLMEQWLHFWNLLRTDASAVYVKVDDDLLFIADGTIEWLIHEKLFDGR